MENREANKAELSARYLDRLFDLFLACRGMEAEAQATWLHDACKGNPSLQREVENLIRQDANADGFLSLPVASIALRPHFNIAPGQRFGRYTILELLGRGGMGEVWKARDEELDRAVALKFLRAGFGAGQLTSEARMASALNHPGIVTVYDVLVWETTPILVMELVAGNSLAKCCNGEMSAEQMISLAEQVASALAAAHAAGIVHGDLKPDNLIRRADGLTKIFDFGLARRVDKSASGLLAGTPLYMSPEQARAEVPGTASDVYSLGLVLYELATGQRPFGTQTLEQIGARKVRPARASTVGKLRFPGGLDWLIDRMLEPDAANRISMDEVAARLRRLQRSSPLPRGWRWWAIAGSAVAASLAVWAWIHPATLPAWLRPGADRFNLSAMNVRPLASQLGLEEAPSLSPDGRWISCLYRQRAGDRPQLQIHSIRGGSPTVVRTGTLTVQGAAAWSPDSEELVFSAAEEAGKHAIYRLKRQSAAVWRIASCRQRSDTGCELDWSPDGKTLAIADRTVSSSELYLLDLATGYRRDLVTREKEYLTTPRFSPDGKWVAYRRQASMTSDDLYVARTSGGPVLRVTENPWLMKGMAWSAGGKSLIAVSARLTNTPQLWQFPLDGKKPAPIGALDGGRGAELSFARNKGSLAWVRDLSSSSLWRMPVERSAGEAERLLYSAAIDADADLSSNGRIVFRSDRSGSLELWIARADGQDVWQATQFRGPLVGDAHWSPDGRSIAFMSQASGNSDIYLMRCEPNERVCGKPRQLTHHPMTDANPTWSRDGNFIYFSSQRTGEYEVWRIPANGSTEPERITWKGGYMAHEHVSGKWLYFSKLWKSTGFWRIALPIRGPGQVETPVVNGTPFSAGATWALGTRELFYYPSEPIAAGRFPAVRSIDLETGLSRDLKPGNVILSRAISLSADERWLLRSQMDRVQTTIMVGE